MDAERPIYTNIFGSVTEKRVILNYKSGSEDIPVNQITSIGFQHKRNYFMAIASFIVSVFFLGFLLIQKNSGIELIIFIALSVALLISAFANWLGHHVIIISAGGQNRKPVNVEMAKTKEGLKFVEAVKSVIYK